MDGVAEADDVPSYVKSHPFGETAVTPTHPDWEYYAQSAVVREYARRADSDEAE